MDIPKFFHRLPKLCNYFHVCLIDGVAWIFSYLLYRDLECNWSVQLHLYGGTLIQAAFPTELQQPGIPKLETSI